MWTPGARAQLARPADPCATCLTDAEWEIARASLPPPAEVGRSRRWAMRAVFDGAICPKEGKTAGLALPHCDAEAMSLHLAEIATMVSPGKHAVLLLDRAGWHLSSRLAVPPNIALFALPPKCPELNPVENLWQFTRENWLSNRVSAPTRTSPTTAAALGTGSSISPGAPCPSACAEGPGVLSNGTCH